MKSKLRKIRQVVRCLDENKKVIALIFSTIVALVGVEVATPEPLVNEMAKVVNLITNKA